MPHHSYNVHFSLVAEVMFWFTVTFGKIDRLSKNCAEISIKSDYFLNKYVAIDSLFHLLLDNLIQWEKCNKNNTSH